MGRINMKTCFAGGVFVIAAVLLSGCVGVSIGNRESKGSSGSAVVVASDPGDQAAMAEINAAAGLSMDNARRDALLAIAQRPGLSPASQVHLANTTYKRLDFDASKVMVLQGLIKNPGFCPPTKQTIMNQLGKLAFDRDRQAILAAVGARESKQ
jgi:hypothetical protein